MVEATLRLSWLPMVLNRGDRNS